MNDSEEDEPVGYGHPPKRHRWPKGKSGNPNGRKKKEKKADHSSIAAILERIDNETVEVNGVRMTRREVELRQLANKALKGDLAAMRQIAKMRQESGMMKPRQRGGVLIVPQAPSLEEWQRRTEADQRQYREGPYPRYDEKADDEESEKD